MSKQVTRRRSIRKGLWAASAGLVLGLVAGCGVLGQDIAVSAPTADGVPSEVALVQLEAIPVKGRAPKTGYSRDQFGPSWEDVDRNGCRTRDDILRRDLTEVVFKAGSKCVVEAGKLVDPYTGKVIEFRRGPDSAAVQIDHVVPLADSWQKGAQGWDAPKRMAFANDPENLIATDGPANSQKGAGDLATWLPPNKAYRCTYAAKTVHIKTKYGLWMTAAEHSAAKQILSNCK